MESEYRETHNKTVRDDGLVYDDERLAAIAWSYAADSGDTRVQEILGVYGYHDGLMRLVSGDKAVVSIAGSSFSTWIRRLESLESWDPRHLDKTFSATLRALGRLGASVVLAHDDLWPAGLNDLGDKAPWILWIRGSLEQLHHVCGSDASTCAAIVGSRAASNRGIRTAIDFSYELAQHYTIVSGGAFGIDAAAHKGAISARGHTVIVSAAGIDRVYPASHRDLFDQVLKGSGLLISEFPLGSAPHAHRFLLRNRLIAALSRATIVIEAPVRSGALSTARAALDIGRPVGAVPGPIDSPSMCGCHELIRNGGTLIASVNHARELLAPIGEQLSISVDSEADFFEPSPSEIGPRGQRVLDAVPKIRPAHLESISSIAGVDLSGTRSELGILALHGLVAQVDGLWVKCSRARAHNT